MGTELTDEAAFEGALAAFDGIDMDDYAGAGNENVTSNDIAIPYINILQKMSPQVDEDDAAYIEGARAGQLFQSVNFFTWDGDDGVQLIPVAFQRMVIEWVPREKGGGMVEIHPMSALREIPNSPNDKNIPVRDDNGNLLIDTAQHVVMYKSPMTGGFEPAMISMKSTNHKKSRIWNSLISQQKLPSGKQAPRWLYSWRCTTIREQKDDNSWYNFEFARESMVDRETFLRCAELAKQHKEGQVRGAEVGEDEIPF